MTPPLYITAIGDGGYLSAAAPNYALLPHVKNGDVLVVIALDREVLFDDHGTDIGHLEMCLGPVEVVNVVHESFGEGNSGVVVLRPLWADLDGDVLGCEVRLVS